MVLLFKTAQVWFWLAETCVAVLIPLICCLSRLTGSPFLELLPDPQHFIEPLLSKAQLEAFPA
jgi:hypothetical protein